MQNALPRIHPIVIYPFVQPKDLSSLDTLFQTLGNICDPDKFERPVTVVNKQTKYRNSESRADSPNRAKAFNKAISEIVMPSSNITEVWAVDTCAMWLRGLGDAYEKAQNSGSIHDVFWLIPGDFKFASMEGKQAIDTLSDIPLQVLNGVCEICLGEISVPLNSAKQLIDTYGTYGLLYNWFPAEAQGIRKITDKPRTEFFALTYQTLENALINSRWYAYEQTLMILLQNMKGDKLVRRMARVNMGAISDDESTRSSLSSAMQQVERTERALKLFWREKAESESKLDWHTEFRDLSAQSESIRTSAMVILRRLLK